MTDQSCPDHSPFDKAEILREHAQDEAQLIRRSLYIYAMSASAFGLIVLCLVGKIEPSLAKSTIDACFSLLELVAITYLGAGVIDRTKLVDRVATRWHSAPSETDNNNYNPPPDHGDPHR